MKKSLLILILFVLLSISATTGCFALEGEDGEGPAVYKTKNYYYTILDNEVLIGRYVGKSSTVNVPSKIKGLPVTTFGVQLDVEGEEEIGFNGNKYVEHITFPKSITEIESFSVMNCKSLKSVNIKGNIKFLEGTFSHCSKLTKISLPDSLEDIDQETFEYTGLTKIIIGKNIKHFSASSIQGTKIKNISVAKGNMHYRTKKGVLYNKNKSILCCYPPNKKAKKFTTLKQTKTIGTIAFCGNSHLKSVFFSKNTKRIGDFAFWGCKKLKKLSFKTKKHVTVCYDAFTNCDSLKQVTLPKCIVKLRTNSFGYRNLNYKTKKVKGFTIKGYKGTAAEKYAKKNGFKFVALDK